MSSRSPLSLITHVFSVIALVAVAVLLAAAALRSIWGVDFWWQYATGRYVVEHGLPSVDVFSYTKAGEPWIELRWLYCLGLYGLVQAFGYAGPIVVKWLMLSVAFGLVARATVKRQSLTITAVVLLAAIMASSQRFFVRPELVTLVMFAVFVWIIARWRTRGGWLIWLLPVLQIIWTNAHTLFILGPLLVGLGLAVTLLEHAAPKLAVDTNQIVSKKRVQKIGLVFVLTSAACLVNPWGIDGVLFPFQLFTQIRGTVFKEYISEFKSPFAIEKSFVALWWYKALIVLCVVSAVANIRRLSLFWTVLVLSQLYLSMLAIRNVPLFALAAVPFVIDNVNRGWLIHVLNYSQAARLLRPITAATVLVTSVWYSWSMVTDRYYVYSHDTNHSGLGLARNRYPLDAIEFMTANNIEGPVLHTFFESAPLLSYGYTVQFDPRLEVYGEDEFKDYWKQFEQPEVLANRQAQFGWRVALISLKSNLINHLHTDSTWSLVYFDSVAAVYLPADVRPDIKRLIASEDFQRISAAIRRNLPERSEPFEDRGIFDRVHSPIPYMTVADALQVFKQPRLPLAFLDDARNAWPGAMGLQRRLAFAHQNAGMRDTAIEDWLVLEDDDPENAEPPYRLGVLYVRTGDTDTAATYLARSLELLDANPDGWALLGKVRAQQGRFSEAIASLKRAIELEPDQLDHRKNLARAFLGAHRFTEAKNLLLELLDQNPGKAVIYCDLAMTLANSGEPEQALQYIDRGLQIMPGQPDLIKLRSMIKQQFNLDSDDWPNESSP